jgi:hypothetical protein
MSGIFLVMNGTWIDRNLGFAISQRSHRLGGLVNSGYGREVAGLVFWLRSSRSRCPPVFQAISNEGDARIVEVEVVGGGTGSKDSTDVFCV